jgi:hypothetical protein
MQGMIIKDDINPLFAKSQTSVISNEEGMH